MPPGLSSAMTLKRIQRELADLKKEDLGDMVLQPSESNLHIWSGRIPGPAGSLYDGGVFELEILLPADYPFSAPKVHFKTRIYHMNISEHGAICIDILKGQWSPALSLFKVMLSLSSLLTDPNPKDPLVPSIAQQYLRSRKQHDETARQWVKTFATPKPPPPAATAAVEKTEKANGKGKTRAAASVASGSGSGSPSMTTVVSTSASASTSAAPAPTASRRSTRSSALATNISNGNTIDGVIVLSDSEAEAEPTSRAQAPKKRKRRSDVAPAPADAEVLELEDSEEERDAPPKRTKPSRVVSTADHATTRNAGNNSSSSATRDEIIVLD